MSPRAGITRGDAVPLPLAEADADLTARGQAIHVRNRGTYGAPTVKQRR